MTVKKNVKKNTCDCRCGLIWGNMVISHPEKGYQLARIKEARRHVAAQDFKLLVA